MDYEKICTALYRVPVALVQLVESYAFPLSGLLVSKISLKTSFEPTSVVVYDGEMFVLESPNACVKVFAKNGTTWCLTRQWGSVGSQPGQFILPECITVDPSTGRILITDTGNYRVQEFLRDGTVTRCIGSEIDSLNKLDWPFGLAVNPAARVVYVSESDADRISIFSLETGLKVGSFTSRGTPLGLHFDVERNLLFIASCHNNQVTVVHTDGSVVQEIKVETDEDDDVKATVHYYPHHVTVDDTGEVFVTCVSNSGVLSTYKDGRPNKQKFGDSQACGLFRHGQLFVADPIQQCIYIYE